jgi:UDP-glucose 4-epimerase
MRILITGKNSFIGNSLKNFLKDKPEYFVDEISVRGDTWKLISFKNYDAIIHLAALVHKKENIYTLSEYEKVNVDLTIEIAKKALKDGVKKFIFLSTMAVFGKTKVIKRNSPLNPSTKYGITKLKAEELLISLFKNSDSSLTILRPPMIYGIGAPGNPRFIEELSKYFPFFPETLNIKSFIHIDNLLRVLFINFNNSGFKILHPQDPVKISTFQLYSKYRQYINKRVFKLKLLGLILKKFSFIGYIDKIFGNLYYDFND